MVLEIKIYPYPTLKQQAQRIEKILKEQTDLAENMVETMYENKGIGLAAPQVGESYRLITVDISPLEDGNKLLILINPKIISQEGKTESEEACLSLPAFKGKIQRAKNVTVKALNLEGDEITIQAEGLLAKCLQHEIDHLNGITLLDRVSHLKKNLYEKKIKKWY